MHQSMIGPPHTCRPGTDKYVNNWTFHIMTRDVITLRSVRILIYGVMYYVPPEISSRMDRICHLYRYK